MGVPGVLLAALDQIIASVMKKQFILILITLLALGAAGSDAIVLVNQKAFKGRIKKVTPCHILFKTNGMTYNIPAGDIHSLYFGDPAGKAARQFQDVGEQWKKCAEGQFDARVYHGKRFGHGVLGFFFGPFAMIGTALANPTPARGAQTLQLSKNHDLFSDPEYLSCYTRKAKGQLIGAEALGMLAVVVLFIAWSP